MDKLHDKCNQELTSDDIDVVIDDAQGMMRISCSGYVGDDGCMESFKINFCPICGKELKTTS